MNLLFGAEFQKFKKKKEKRMNTFKHKTKHYYMNDLCNPNLWNIGAFNSALAIIKNVFLFIKQIFLHLFFLLHSDWRTAIKIRLFACFVLPCHTIFLLTNIAININNFCFNFFIVWLLSFFVTIWIFCFLRKDKTYLLILLT